MGNQGTITSHRAVLTFLDALGDAGTFSIPRADAGITEAQARVGMQEIIASGALAIGAMDRITAAKSAKLVTTVRTVVVS